MTSVIDLDRGASIRRHKETGIYIAMYKDDPGVYLDQLGNEVSIELAREVGFPVDALARAKARKDKVGAFFADLDKVTGDEDASTTLVERGSYKVLSWPGDRAVVVDNETGERLHPLPLPKETALRLLDKLVPVEVKEGKKDGGKAA